MLHIFDTDHISLLQRRNANVIARLERISRRQQVRIGTKDLRIAALALSKNATLVTRNTRDFAKVPGLHMVDWSR